MSFEVKFYADRPAWLNGRIDGIGGSDASVLWDVSSYHSRYSLFQEKVNGVRREEGKEESEWLRLGQKLEPVIADIYAEDTGYEVEYPGPFVIFRSIERPWMYASLDRIIRGNPKGKGYLECKNRNAWAIKEWNTVGAPLDVQAQVQHVLAITDWDWGAIACLFGGNMPRFIEVERDEEFIGMHLEKCEKFYRDHLLAKVPPELDGSEHTTTALKLQYGKGNGNEIELPEDAVEWDAKLVALKEQIKGAEKEAKLYENHIRAAIGEAGAGIVPGGGVYRFTDFPASQVEAFTKKSYRRLDRRTK